MGAAAPRVAVLRRYDRVWLRGDVLAGITVAAYLVPQVMAYAEVAGLPASPACGPSPAALLVYALLGSSRQLSVGPESTTAPDDGRRRSGPLAAGPGAVWRCAEAAALSRSWSGVICLAGWVARLGFLADLLSKPVLVGYMAGIAALMIVSQLGKVTGITCERQLVRPGGGIVRHPPRPRAPADAAPVAGVLVVLFAFQRLPPRCPGR